jgi:plasmid stabilization system protein ParE
VKVRLSREARRDRRRISAWYARRSPAAAASFVSRLREAFAFLSDHPHGAPIIQGDLRAKTLRDFPISIHYRIVREEVRVLSLFDERRDPDDRPV